MHEQLVDDGGQAAAVDELHGVVVDPLVAADAEDRHDVGVVQLRGRLGLDLEPLALLGVDRRREREDLQGDPAAQRDLLGLVDDAHAPPPDLAEDAVVAELGPGRDGLGRSVAADRPSPRAAAAVWMNSSPERHSPSASAISACWARNSSRDQGRPTRSASRYASSAATTRGSF